MLLIMGCMCLFWQINWLPMLFSALAVQALGYGLDSLVSGIFCTVTGISLSALLQQNTEQRAVLHDTTNILLAIDGLLENGQQEQALALTRQLTEHCTPATRYVSTQNPTVDAVLNDQCAKAAAAGIQLFIEVCSLQNLAMQDLDIVILFSNLLDNARHACLACEGARRIAIQAVPSSSGQVRLTIRNTYAGPDAALAPKPSAERRAGIPRHGYGKQNAQRVLRRYHCDYAVDQAAGWYRVLVLLPCPAQPEE